MLGKLYPLDRPPWGVRPSSPSAARRHSLIGTQVRRSHLRGCCTREYFGCDCPPGPHSLSHEDRKRLEWEGGREHFLDIKLRALGKVCEWLRARKGDSVWGYVRPVLTDPKEGLLADDVTFYLRVDRAFKIRNFQHWGVFDLGLPYKCPGGLTALLQMVMHWDMEKILGTNAARIKTLGAFAPGRLDAPDPRPRSYFDLIHTPGMDALDACLGWEPFDSDNAKAFHAGFVRQVNMDLATAERGRKALPTNDCQNNVPTEVRAGPSPASGQNRGVPTGVPAGAPAPQPPIPAHAPGPPSGEKAASPKAPSEEDPGRWWHDPEETRPAEYLKKSLPGNHLQLARAVCPVWSRKIDRRGLKQLAKAGFIWVVRHSGQLIEVYFKDETRLAKAQERFNKAEAEEDLKRKAKDAEERRNREDLE